MVNYVVPEVDNFFKHLHNMQEEKKTVISHILATKH